MTDVLGVDQEESTEASELRSDFAFATWTLVDLFQRAGLSRRVMMDVLCHVAHADSDHWAAAITAVNARGQRDHSPVFVFDRSRSTP